MNLFKKKERSEVLNTFISHLMREILIHDFSNTELAIICNSVRDQGKSILESRKEVLEKKVEETYKEIKETSKAIESL